jgi:hypothetical protein
MKIEELTGNSLKRLLGCERVRKTYHNHNKQGGNFGFVIVYKYEGVPKPFFNEDWFMLHGDHDTEGNITDLKFGTYAGLGNDITPSIDYLRSVVDAIKVYVVSHKGAS